MLRKRCAAILGPVGSTLLPARIRTEVDQIWLHRAKLPGQANGALTLSISGAGMLSIARLCSGPDNVRAARSPFPRPPTAAWQSHGNGYGA